MTGAAAALSLEAAVARLGTRQVLAGASFSARPGQLTGLVGPNGAGKTSAVRALMGQLPLMSGTARVGAQDPFRLPPLELARTVAWLPQVRPLAWPVRVREVVALGRYAHAGPLGRLAAADRAAVDAALAACALDAFADRSVASLSGGELARVHLARVLASGTPALIADEPTASLDPRQAFQMMDLLAARARAGAAVLVIVHDLALAARSCDRIVVLDGGAVKADGPPHDALTASVLQGVFGVSGSISAPGAPLLVTGPL
jgi:iron complex transport system ATP-binding protein